MTLCHSRQSETPRNPHESPGNAQHGTRRKDRHCDRGISNSAGSLRYQRFATQRDTIRHTDLQGASPHPWLASQFRVACRGVVDIDGRKVSRRLEGFDEPQGIAYSPQTDTLYVASGGDGVLSSFRGAQLESAGKLDLGDDADNVRIDREQQRVYVGVGGGNLTVVDGASFKKIAEIELKGHPESFQLESEGSRTYVNVPDAREVAVIDRKAGKQVGSWPTSALRSNYPMALDSPHGRVFVAFRQPATLVSYDAASGAVQERIEICGDADDIFVDARRGRIYVVCGQGVIDVLREGDRTSRIARVATSSGARTALFSPELDRLFVAARATGGEGAAVWVFRPVDNL